MMGVNNKHQQQRRIVATTNNHGNTSSNHDVDVGGTSSSWLPLPKVLIGKGIVATPSEPFNNDIKTINLMSNEELMIADEEDEYHEEVKKKKKKGGVGATSSLLMPDNSTTDNCLITFDLSGTPYQRLGDAAPTPIATTLRSKTTKSLKAIASKWDSNYATTSEVVKTSTSSKTHQHSKRPVNKKVVDLTVPPMSSSKQVAFANSNLQTCKEDDDSVNEELHNDSTISQDLVRRKNNEQKYLHEEETENSGTATIRKKKVSFYGISGEEASRDIDNRIDRDDDDEDDSDDDTVSLLFDADSHASSSALLFQPVMSIVSDATHSTMRNDDRSDILYQWRQQRDKRRRKIRRQRSITKEHNRNGSSSSVSVSSNRSRVQKRRGSLVNVSGLQQNTSTSSIIISSSNTKTSNDTSRVVSSCWKRRLEQYRQRQHPQEESKAKNDVCEENEFIFDAFDLTKKDIDGNTGDILENNEPQQQQAKKASLDNQEDQIEVMKDADKKKPKDIRKGKHSSKSKRRSTGKYDEDTKDVGTKKKNRRRNSRREDCTITNENENEVEMQERHHRSSCNRLEEKIKRDRLKEKMKKADSNRKIKETCCEKEKSNKSPLDNKMETKKKHRRTPNNNKERRTISHRTTTKHVSTKTGDHKDAIEDNSEDMHHHAECDDGKEQTVEKMTKTTERRSSRDKRKSRTSISERGEGYNTKTLRSRKHSSKLERIVEHPNSSSETKESKRPVDTMSSPTCVIPDTKSNSGNHKKDSCGKKILLLPTLDEDNNNDNATLMKATNHISAALTNNDEQQQAHHTDNNNIEQLQQALKDLQTQHEELQQTVKGLLTLPVDTDNEKNGQCRALHSKQQESDNKGALKKQHQQLLSNAEVDEDVTGYEGGGGGGMIHATFKKINQLASTVIRTTTATATTSSGSRLTMENGNGATAVGADTQAILLNNGHNNNCDNNSLPSFVDMTEHTNISDLSNGSAIMRSTSVVNERKNSEEMDQHNNKNKNSSNRRNKRQQQRAWKAISLYSSAGGGGNHLRGDGGDAGETLTLPTTTSSNSMSSSSNNHQYGAMKVTSDNHRTMRNKQTNNRTKPEGWCLNHQ